MKITPIFHILSILIMPLSGFMLVSGFVDFVYNDQNWINFFISATITPTPPSHCKSDLHANIPGGEASMFMRMVDPVVVIPDIDSKKESVKPRFILLK